MKNKVFSGLFFLVFCADLIAIYAENALAVGFIKPLITIVLMAWVWSATQLKGRFHKRVLMGLLFALAGDVALLYQGVDPKFFMYGLAAFFLCHVFYIRAFALDHWSNPEQKNPYFLWAVGVLGIFCVGLFFYLQPHLGGLQFPVLAYAIVISVMAIMAINRYGKVNITSFKLIMYGSLFFVFSDTVLAVSKFVNPIPQSSSLIMASYMIAQYLIAYGTVERKLVVSKTAI
ncbi:lysoplasmalogenase [Pedobacter sp. MW01-1-1]|uniref:lysoplasmalogenase n=1 Tax=Pedobacter sp. MW01-1-1 TaxID=3383027 RepID=UPI003FED7A86